MDVMVGGSNFEGHDHVLPLIEQDGCAMWGSQASEPLQCNAEIDSCAKSCAQIKVAMSVCSHFTPIRVTQGSIVS